MLALGFVLVAGAVAGVIAAPNPTEPSGTSVFNVGQQCTVKWDADTTSAWKNMNIQLMTGDNYNMVHITTVGQNIDATDATKNTYSYTCPDVTPNSAIYFLQFSDPSNATDLLWTTRWTIAGADGKTTTPTETTQPNGDKIPWGKGALVDPSTAVAPPSYLSNNQANGSANSTTSAVAGSSSAAAATSAPAATTPVVVATTPAAGSSSHAAGSSSTARAATTGGATTGASSSNSNTTSTSQTTANGAISTSAVSGFAALGAFVAALGLF